jgi:hypothetical protein
MQSNCSKNEQERWKVLELTDLEQELSTNLHVDLVKELLADYQDLKQRYRLRDLSPTVAAAGRFCEDTLKCIIFFKENRLTSKMGLRFAPKYDEIMNYPTPTDTIEEYKYRLIPQAALAVYLIRNKKRGQHSRGETLLQIDLQYIVKACDWILASLLYVSHGVPEDEAIEMMNRIVKYDMPLVQEIGGYFVLTKTDLEIEDALLILLFSFGGSANQADVVRNLKIRYGQSTAYRAIRECHDAGLLFRHPQTRILTLLSDGILRAQESADSISGS